MDIKIIPLKSKLIDLLYYNRGCTAQMGITPFVKSSLFMLFHKQDYEFQLVQNL